MAIGLKGALAALLVCMVGSQEQVAENQEQEAIAAESDHRQEHVEPPEEPSDAPLELVGPGPVFQSDVAALDAPIEEDQGDREAGADDEQVEPKALAEHSLRDHNEGWRFDWLGLGSLIAAAAAVGIAYISFRYTSRLTKIQTRAYLHHSATSFEWSDEDNAWIVVLEIENCGVTPATLVSHQFGYYMRPDTGRRDGYADIEFGDQRSDNYVIGPSKTVSVPFTLDDFGSDEAIEVERGGQELVVAAEFEYLDIYNRPQTTRTIIGVVKTLMDPEGISYLQLPLAD